MLYYIVCRNAGVLVRLVPSLLEGSPSTTVVIVIISSSLSINSHMCIVSITGIIISMTVIMISSSSSNIRIITSIVSRQPRRADDRPGAPGAEGANS